MGTENKGQRRDSAMFMTWKLDVISRGELKIAQSFREWEKEGTAARTGPAATRFGVPLLALLT